MGRIFFRYRGDSPEKEKVNKFRRITIIKLFFLSFCAMTLIAAITFAWFADTANIATLVDISSPSIISIKGAHGQEMMELDLSYTDTDKDENGNITIRRVVSVCNDSASHRLEIVHTTNMKGLNFKIYKAAEVANDGSSSGDTDDTGSVTESVNAGDTSKMYKYSYNANNPLTGSYINVKASSENDGAGSDVYRYADNTKHEFNYNEYPSDKVQIHAEPVYWLATGNLQSETKNTYGDDPILAAIDSKYVTYYVIEISWTEQTKETDIFYLLAQNV